MLAYRVKCPGSVAWPIMKPCRGFDSGSKSNSATEAFENPDQGVLDGTEPFNEKEGPVAQPGRKLWAIEHSTFTV